ncbi:hypothetical protein D049_0566A, partial [Vibrio parahaemolyticus VPTS-2010]
MWLRSSHEQSKHHHKATQYSE